MKLRLEFKLEDFWIGFFWRVAPGCAKHDLARRVDLWVCVVPCLPLHITWETTPRPRPSCGLPA